MLSHARIGASGGQCTALKLVLPDLLSIALGLLGFKIREKDGCVWMECTQVLAVVARGRSREKNG